MFRYSLVWQERLCGSIQGKDYTQLTIDTMEKSFSTEIRSFNIKIKEEGCFGKLKPKISSLVQSREKTPDARFDGGERCRHGICRLHLSIEEWKEERRRHQWLRGPTAWFMLLNPFDKGLSPIINALLFLINL